MAHVNSTFIVIYDHYRRTKYLIYMWLDVSSELGGAMGPEVLKQFS